MEYTTDQSQSELTTTQEPTDAPETTDLSQTDATPTDTPPSITDLESLEKFKFGGREWTPKELKSAYMMQQDYSKKTQEIAQERKYNDNLIHDLRTIRKEYSKNPNIIDEFKKVYPKKYHAWADEVLDVIRTGSSKPSQPQMSDQEKAALPPEVQRKIDLMDERLSHFEKNTFDAEVAKHAAELDTIIGNMGKKYPFADEEQVLSRAQVLRERGEELDEKVWDGLFKMVNDKNESFFKQRQGDLIKKQASVNSKAKDVPSGGGTPGTAPRKFKTFDEASEAAMRDFA